MNKKAQTLSFSPKKLNKKLLQTLPKRAEDILTARFGLGTDTAKKSLESIGKKYGVTRERIRQIADYSIKSIRKSEAYSKEQSAYDELKKVVKDFGGIVRESEFLSFISSDKSSQNHVNFMLTVSDHFNREKEDEEFHHRWNINKELADKIHKALRKLYENLTDEQIVPESDMVKMFLDHVEDLSDEYKNEEIIKRWLTVSKKLGKNPLGEWGKSHSQNISAKGTRDYAYLIIRKHGSPIHFKEVAKLIEKTFKRRAHVATAHNELIKDPRFVLVGRGLYALTEWGYEKGVVKDVIKGILGKEGPLTKEEIIDKVLKERYVKDNTVLVNLNNPKFFKKDKDNKYHIA